MVIISTYNILASRQKLIIINNNNNGTTIYKKKNQENEEERRRILHAKQSRQLFEGVNVVDRHCIQQGQ